MMTLLSFERELALLYKELEEKTGLEKKELKNLIEERLKVIYKSLTPYNIVEVARHPDRPQTLDYIKELLTNFVEIKGDRISGEDRSIIAGIGKFNGLSLTVIGSNKGHTIIERLKSNSGMIGPSGFRKIARAVDIASNTFKTPILTFIDTPGARVSPETEKEGSVAALSEPIKAFLKAKVPVLSVVIGEGGSLGALSLLVSDRILMLSYSYLSVISPEVGASVLFKDRSMKKDIAKALKITSEELLSFNVINGIIEEPFTGAHRNPELTIQTVKEALQKEFELLLKEPSGNLLKRRAEKFEKFKI
jgi:acetyl-CoA carboxylase carboxyl transferase subunit alpha